MVGFDVIVDWFCGEDKASNKLTLGTVCIVASIAREADALLKRERECSG